MTKPLTAAQIAAKIHCMPRENMLKYIPNPTRRKINKVLRLLDNSDKWPINSAFCVTSRAIERAKRYERFGDAMDNYEYILFVDAQASEIVNNPKNW